MLCVCLDFEICLNVELRQIVKWMIQNTRIASSFLRFLLWLYRLFIHLSNKHQHISLPFFMKSCNGLLARNLVWRLKWSSEKETICCVAVEEFYGVCSQNQFEGSTKLSFLYRVLTGQNWTQKDEMIFFVSFLTCLTYGPKNFFWPLEGMIPLILEKTHSLRYPVFRI